jgi:hypothetical protein
MTKHFADPPRWREHSDQSNAAERTLGQDLRAIRTPAPLTGAQMARIVARMRPSRVGPSRTWLVLAAALILGVATGASATHLSLVPRWLTRANAPQPDVAPKAPSEHRMGRRKAPAAEVAPAPAAQPKMDMPAQPGEEPSFSPQPTTASPAIPGATLGRRPRHDVIPVLPTGQVDHVGQRGDSEGSSRSSAGTLSPPAVQPQSAPWGEPSWPSPASLPTPTGPAVPSQQRPTVPPAQVAMLNLPRPQPSAPLAPYPRPAADATASGLLADAIRLLRADGRPQAALALLDRHAPRLGQSPYAHEALLVRVEALLALKRDAELLQLLDGMPLADVAASRTLLTIRGRLRASAKRCAEAVADFDRVLVEAGNKDKQALLGRALCREATGDHAGAKADRERAGSLGGR